MKTRIEEPYFVLEAESAEEFLEALQLKGEYWHMEADGWRSKWLFRGQSWASKSLKPTLWRDDEDSLITKLAELRVAQPHVTQDRWLIEDRLLKNSKYGKLSELSTSFVDNAVNLYIRMLVETELIETLVDRAMRRAVAIPNYSKIMGLVVGYKDPHFFISRITSEELDAFDFDFDQVITNSSLFALAQHHGIPTRLLDWTRSAAIAAFFAADDAVARLTDNKKRDTHLAVFAAHESVLQLKQIFWYPFPRSDNAYLMAQRGELTLYRGSHNFLMTGEYPSVDQLLSGIGDWDEHIRPIKITLRLEESPRLLRLLSIHYELGKDQLMPTFDNIVNVVKQQYLMDLM